MIFVVCIGWSAGAAPASPERIRLSYEAIAGCPDRAQFVGLIAAHAQIEIVDDAEARGLDVSVVGDGEGLRGVLAVGGASREVLGATCDEVVAAIALVAALAIERREAARTPEGLVRDVQQPAIRSWRLAAGGGVGRFTGITPDGRLGAPIFVALASEHGPQLRFALDITSRDDVAGPAGSTSFRWIGGQLDGCPYVWSRGRFDLAPCVGLQAGVTDARGVGLAMAATTYRPWIAPTGILRLGVRIGRATVGAEAAIGAPLVRDRFVIGPNTTAYRVPGIATNLALTVGITIF